VVCLFTALTSPLQAGGPEVILDKSGVKGGLIVHLGPTSGHSASLKQNDRFFVHCLDTDSKRIEEARRELVSRGLYGGVSLMHLTEYRLPYVDSLVNLLLVEEPANISREEMMRVVTPLGVLCIKERGQRTKTVKPWPNEIDEWTHFLHNPPRTPPD
jgi:hypothetical protein